MIIIHNVFEMNRYYQTEDNRLAEKKVTNISFLHGYHNKIKIF